ncbi:MAG: hypothetical protein ACK5UY_06460, partial [Holosporales bacterium]
MSLWKGAVQPPLPRSGGGVRPSALRGGGEQPLVDLTYKHPRPHLPPLRGRRRQRAAALFPDNAGIEPISGLVCIGQAERRGRQSGSFG